MWWRLYRDQDTMHSSLLASSLTQESNLILLSVAGLFLLFTSLCLSFYLLHSFHLSLSMPWVGGHCWRWEVRARVCAGNHGNCVLIGQWSGRMIVSCCQWGLFMQTCSRFGRPQMGPSAMRGAGRRVYSLFFQFEPSNQFLEILVGVNPECAARCAFLRCVVLCVSSQLVCVCL